MKPTRSARNHCLAIGAMIAASLGLFISSLFATHFPVLRGSRDLLEPALSQIISGCTWYSTSLRFTQTLASYPVSSLCLAWNLIHCLFVGVICFNFFPFPLGTASFHFVLLSHLRYHLYYYHTFYKLPQWVGKACPVFDVGYTHENAVYASSLFH